MKRFLFNLITAVAGIWLASQFVPGVMVAVMADSRFFGFPLTANWEIIVILGVILGLLNFFVKPILNAIAFPLRIVTLGAFNLVICMALLWILDAMFKELFIPLYLPLLYTTLIIWGLDFAASFLIKNKS